MELAAMADTHEDLAAENARLKRELSEMQHRQERDLDVLQQRNGELESAKTRMVRLTRQLDEEVSKRDQIEVESQALERKLHEVSKGGNTGNAATLSNSMKSRSRDNQDGREDEAAAREKGSQVSTKLMRVVDQWMRHRDLQEALLRGASINDQSFTTLVQAFVDCRSLQTLDLSQNLLTMDSCSDICQLITTAPSLSFISLADNLFSLRSVGYFMTAVMERQNTKKLMPLDLLDLQGNEGLVAAATAPVPDSLMSQVTSSMGNPGAMPPKGMELIVQVMRGLWRFLHDSGHPQVRNTKPDEIAFHTMDKVTIRKMDSALMKILLLGVDDNESGNTSALRPITANLALVPLDDGSGNNSPHAHSSSAPVGGLGNTSRSATLDTFHPTATGGSGVAGSGIAGSGVAGSTGRLGQSSSAPQLAGTQGSRRGAGISSLGGTSGLQKNRQQLSDPFADLRTAFEPPRQKQKTFNLDMVVTRKGIVLMNMIERLLETTEIDAVDGETGQTLLEFACQTGDLRLAKLCFLRKANLSAKTKKGDTPFNIVTRHRNYEMMEFLHTYGVRVNSADAQGVTALHVAAAGDDVDAVCRLLEWGADVNCRDHRKQTPIHMAAAGGKMKTTMLLLEVGADMNTKDDRGYTAMAHAEKNNNFDLMDRLEKLGGRGIGPQTKAGDWSRTKSGKQLGEIVVSAGMLKSSSLGRIGKVAVSGMPGPLSPGGFR